MPTQAFRGPTACNTARQQPRAVARCNKLLLVQTGHAQSLVRTPAPQICQALSPGPAGQPPESTPSAVRLSTIDSKQRRRLLVQFTCGKCGAFFFSEGSRSERLVNPDAYRRGTVFVQCQGCEVWHQLVDNMNLIQEYDLSEMPLSEAGQEFKSKLQTAKVGGNVPGEEHSSDVASTIECGEDGSSSGAQDQVGSLTDSTESDVSSTVPLDDGGLNSDGES